MAKQAKFTEPFLTRYEPEKLIEYKALADLLKEEYAEFFRKAAGERLEREKLKLNPEQLEELKAVLEVETKKFKEKLKDK